MNRYTVVESVLRHTDTRVAAATLTVLGAVAFSLLPVAVGYTFCVLVMAVNLFAATATYLKTRFTTVLTDTRFTGYPRAVLFAATVLGFATAVYFSPVFAVAMLGVLTGAAAISFIDVLAQTVAVATHRLPEDDIAATVFTVSFLAAGLAAVLGRQLLTVFPGVADAFLFGGLIALPLVFTSVTATLYWGEAAVFRGVGLVESAAYLSWFLPVSFGYMVYGVVAETYLGPVTVAPWTAVAIIFIVVFSVLSTTVKRFDPRSLPMVNLENVGYVFLYLLSAVTVFWLSITVSGLPATALIRVFRFAALAGTGVAFLYAFYHKYQVVTNREPWHTTTYTPPS